MAAKFRELLWKYGIYLLPLAMLCLHIPFLLSDPDFHLSHSRDAHSDEGLNTSQLRNFVNYGVLNPWECDNLIKNPLFNLVLWAPFSVFGTHLLTGRITLLLLVMGIVILLGRNRHLRSVWLAFIPIGMLQFHIFSYSHFSMAEMLATGFILVAVHQLVLFFLKTEKGCKRRHLLYALLFSSLAWYTKIQFLYIAALVPLIIGSWWLYRLLRYRKADKEMMILAGIGVLGMVVFGGLYYAGWYLPLQKPYTYIMNNQASDRFAHWPDFMPVVKENYLQYFTRSSVFPLFLTCCIAIPVGGILLFNRPALRIYRYAFPVALGWVLLESHKLFIHFVPSRYLVSAYVAMALLIAIVCAEAVQRLLAAGARRTWISLLCGCLLLAATAVVAGHIRQYHFMHQRRTYTIHQINRYLAQYSLYPATALGPWAPSLCWDTRIRVVPVWSGFLNDKNILATHHPRIIFAEPDEADSEQAFQKDGIRLMEMADSIYSFQVGRWPVNLYWMPPDTTETRTLP